jgi:hypothetical protein
LKYSQGQLTPGKYNTEDRNYFNGNSLPLRWAGVYKEV